MKVFKIQLSPTPAQAKAIEKQITEHRGLYNTCLAKKIAYWKDAKKNLSAYDLIKSEIPPLKASGAISNYSSLQQTIRRLDKSYQAFFRKGGFPRFKGEDRFRTLEYTYGDGCKIKQGKLYLQNVGMIKCLHLREPAKIKALSVTRDGGNYYVNLSYEYTGDIDVKRTDKAVGLDFGLINFLTTSDGEVFQSPKFLKRSLKENAKIHRRIHKASKGSLERKKHKLTLAKANRKIGNRRKDFNHKLSRKLVNAYDIVVVEDVKLADLKARASEGPKPMARNINRSYSDVAFGQFRNFISYKAENAGKIFVKVNPAYTTQECYSCGTIVEKTLKQRVHSCPCGYTADRDFNAAQVILRRGLASLQYNLVSEI